MGLPRSNIGEARFLAYVEGLTGVIGHADRVKPFRDYCLGLMMPCERKSVEPIAAITAPERTAAQHQSLLHFISEGIWSDEKVLAQVRELVLPEMERPGPIEAWIIDDTSFPKKGRHSVGVARQYCGELGKQDNCQVAVTLSIANHDSSLPVAYRLYLPKDWASDRKRRRKVGVPDEISFKTKPEIALTQIRWACGAGLPRGVVLMDAGFGCDTELRTSVTALGLHYVAGIQSHTTVWALGTGPRPPKKWSGHGRPPKLMRRDDKHKPASVKELALALPKRAWRTIVWREATAEKLSSRFARVRVRVAHRALGPGDDHHRASALLGELGARRMFGGGRDVQILRQGKRGHELYLAQMRLMAGAAADEVIQDAGDARGPRRIVSGLEPGRG